jgi:hypothetical protein
MGLTTTATFDDRTDEFIIHSPNLMVSNVVYFQRYAHCNLPPFFVSQQSGGLVDWA